MPRGSQLLLQGSLDDLVDEPQPREDRGSRGQDVGPVKLVDAPGLDGRDPCPARALADGFEVHAPAAPGGQDNLRIAPRNLRRIHHPLLRGSPDPQLREDVPSPRDLDDLGHPADAGDRGIGPLLEIHARMVGPHARELADLLELVADVLHQAARFPGTPQRAAHHQDGGEDIVHGALIGAEDGEPGADQLGRDVRLKVGEGQHQVGLELDDLVPAEAREAPALRPVPRLGRALRRPRHPDHAIPCPERVADLHVLGGEADDAGGEVGGGLAVHAPSTIPDARAGARGLRTRVIYCRPMFEPAPERADHVPLPAPPSPYFSGWIPLLATLLVAALLGLFTWPLSSSPLLGLDRPEESLERLVSSELDLRAALPHAPPWEVALYALLAGAGDPIEESIAWYEELTETLDAPRAEIYRQILLAEAGRLPPEDPTLASAAWMTAAH